jgi:hypothetical protein
MTQDSEEHEELNPELPPEPILGALAAVNLAWAHLDALVSAALFSIMGVDPVEFGIIVGRLETQAKLDKMLKILRHRARWARGDNFWPQKKRLTTCGHSEMRLLTALTTATSPVRNCCSLRSHRTS